MRAKGRGWIVNVSSATSKHPSGPPLARSQSVGVVSATYGSSKAALERYTTGLASELYGEHIAVNSVAPVAAVRTPGADELVADIMAANPGIVEPMEVMVEAILALCTCDPDTLTGRITFSGPLLDELGIEPRNLDGSPIS
jgi:NAD(P)-dependent dehydrogenase (short-subunit alcohol dehydrogenase family)